MVLNRRALTGVIVCLVSLFCSFPYCEAQVNWRKFSYFTNYGGLNDNLSDTEIADNEASSIQNVTFDTGGAIKKRKGYISIPTAAQKVDVSASVVGITGLAFYQKNNGSKFVVATTNSDNKATVRSKTYDSNNELPSGAWDDLTTGALPQSGYTNNDLTSFTVAEDKLVFAFNSSTQVKPFKWTGEGRITTLTADSDCPNATIVVYHKNHLFLSGNSNYPSRVYFSALDDITSYDATDFFDVQTSDGTQVRGIISAFDGLYIFKDRSIWRLSGSDKDNFVLEKLVNGIGSLSHNSIKIVNNYIYFTTAQNDIAIYDGGYKVQFLSQKIRNTIGGLNFSRANKTLGLAFSTYKYNDYDYYCAVSNSGSATNNLVLLFDTAYKAWSKFLGITPNAWCVAENSNKQDLMILGDTNGYVYSYPSSNYIDAQGTTSDAIVAFYQTKWFKYSDISLGDKYWRRLKTYALAESTDNTFLTLECKADYETSGKTFLIPLSGESSLWDSALWDTDVWGGQTLIVDTREPEKGTQMFQIKYSNNNVSEGFTIIGWESYIEPTEQI